MIQPGTTLKDLNFEKIISQGICFKPNDKDKIIGGLRKDVAFLRSLGLMDYSLLLCIEKSTEDCNKNQE